MKKIFKELDIFASRLQKLETGEQSRDSNPYKSIWKLENFSVTFNNAKLYEETKNKNDTDPNLVCDFCSTDFFSKLYGCSFFIRAFPLDVILGANPVISLF